MRCLLACTLGCCLFMPGLLRADSALAATFDIPFDDIDPTVAQAEVARHIEGFVKGLDAQWGTSQDAVRARLHGELEREDGSALITTGTLLDHGVVEGYDFRDGTLVRGQYVILQRPVNGLNEFIEYYAAVKESLTQTYGRPNRDETIWENDLYQPLPDYWGIAVQLGHLRYLANWTTPDGVITVELTGNHHSRLMIEYRSRTFADNARAA